MKFPGKPSDILSCMAAEYQTTGTNTACKAFWESFTLQWLYKRAMATWQIMADYVSVPWLSASVSRYLWTLTQGLQIKDFLSFS